jgi:7-keto-8-aminopelargonate synthetase-like enzyme
MNRKHLPGITAQLKEKLIQQSLERRLRRTNAPVAAPAARAAGTEGAIPEQFTRFDLHPGYQQLRIMSDGAAKLGIASPFFKLHEGCAGARTRIGGREYVNFSSYNYLGLSGHPAVSAAAKAAIDRYGTSVSASRPVSGERPIHRELEGAIASAYGAEDAIVYVSGHATNVTT